MEAASSSDTLRIVKQHGTISQNIVNFQHWNCIRKGVVIRYRAALTKTVAGTTVLFVTMHTSAFLCEIVSGFALRLRCMYKHRFCYKKLLITESTVATPTVQVTHCASINHCDIVFGLRW